MKELPKALFIVCIVSLLGDKISSFSSRYIYAYPHGSGLAPGPGFTALMQGIISVTLLAAALFIVLSKRYSPHDKHWAYTTLGTILGFWLPK
jgi:hypothetical protein